MTGGRSSPLTEPNVYGSGELRKFGLLFAGVGAVLASVVWWKDVAWWWIPALGAGLFALSGLLAPSLLRPVYRPWMAFAGFLGWLNTKILLTLFFALVITPVGLVLRLFRRDLLEQRMGTSAESYWKQREDTVTDKSRFENLF